MKRALGAIVGMLGLALVAGCTTTTTGKRDVSLEKAAQANAQLGTAYLRGDRLNLADQKLRRALEQDSKNVDAHMGYALLNMELEKPELAREHFQQALELAPNRPDLRNNYGTFLCNQGEREAGIEQLLSAANNRLYETPQFAYANAGRCARKAGRHEEAREYLRQALEEAPRLPSALRHSALLALDTGRPGEAQEFYQRYTKVAEQDAETLWLGVRIERALGNREAAKQYGVKLLRQYRDSPQAQQFLESR